MGLVPGFTAEGLLPPGDYEMTLEALAQSPLVLGPVGGDGGRVWDSAWRRGLVDNLAVLVRQLRRVGITTVYIDGSFAEDKPHPNDIDGYFECDLERLASGALQRALNALDPHRVWTWDPAARRGAPGSPKRQLPMWHQYRVELYPHVPGLSSGISDASGHELEFPAAFRRSRRDGRPRGIVKIIPGGSM